MGNGLTLELPNFGRRRSTVRYGGSSYFQRGQARKQENEVNPEHIMSRSTDPGHFFQSSAALSEISRKAAKSKNSFGNPIRLPSKILAVIADPDDAGRVFVAEAAGTVRRVVLEVCKTPNSSCFPQGYSKLMDKFYHCLIDSRDSSRLCRPKCSFDLPYAI